MNVNVEKIRSDVHEKIENLNLTRREKEILSYWALNLTYKQIADLLNISNKTVRTHISNIYSKLGINSKNMLLLLLLENQE
jgi:Response regulator containing a CheY-like receiver domain and an HTH DNA-binding domain